jgi:F420-dependent oxidoreductase-like protein
MKLGLMLGYWTAGPEDPIELVLEAERLGYDSVWTAEAYGSDAISPLCWIGARTTKIKLGTSVTQISARTPACMAMTAMTIDHLSHGRLLLGLGVSGPQVVEGWYGQPFPRPLERTREYVHLLRTMLKREGYVSFQGKQYQLPYPGGMGIGKPLKLINQPLRAHVPIYLGAMGPKNIQLSKEIADGWLPLYMSPYRMKAVYGDVLNDFPPGFEIPCPVQVVVGDDLEQCLFPVKMTLAFYIGGMGHKSKNFSKEQIDRMGYKEAADQVQQLFLEGKRGDAIEAVPNALADEIALCGPLDRIKDRLQAWRDTPVTTLVTMARDPAVLRQLAEMVL